MTGLVAWSVSCQSGGTHNAQLEASQVQTSLQASLAGGDQEWASMVASNKPMMLVFWQSW